MNCIVTNTFLSPFANVTVAIITNFTAGIRARFFRLSSDVHGLKMFASDLESDSDSENYHFDESEEEPVPV